MAIIDLPLHQSILQIHSSLILQRPCHIVIMSQKKMSRHCITKSPRDKMSTPHNTTSPQPSYYDTFDGLLSVIMCLIGGAPVWAPYEELSCTLSSSASVKNLHFPEECAMKIYINKSPCLTVSRGLLKSTSRIGSAGAALFSVLSFGADRVSSFVSAAMHSGSEQPRVR